MSQEKQSPYKNQYLIYTRKSTDDSDNQKNSHAYQRNEIIRFVKREKISIAPLTIEGFVKDGIISESHSGFKEDDDFEIGSDYVKYKVPRPKFHKLIQMLNNGEIAGVVFLSPDRASRNKSDSAMLNKLIKKGLDIRFALATYDKSSSGEFHRDLDNMVAEHYSRVASEKITLATRKMRDEGICTYRAPIGYLNEGDPRRKPFDPKRAPLVKKLFEKYAEGTWSLIDLARWANKQGLTMPPTRRKRTAEEMLRTEDEVVDIKPTERPLRTNNIHWILRNQFYIGKIIGNDGVWTQSTSHKPLVDEQLFWKVQELLTKKKVSVHYTKKLPFPYRGMIRCEICGRAYSPYAKGEVHYYGARCRDGCTNTERNINASFIEENIAKELSRLYFSEEELKEIDQRMKTVASIWEENKEMKLEELDNKIRHTKENLSYLQTNKLSLLKDKVYSPEEYIEEEAKILRELNETKKQKENIDIDIKEKVKDIVKLSEIVKSTHSYYRLAKPSEKAEIMRNIFSEISFSGRAFSFKYQKGFKVLEDHNFLFGDPGRNRTYITTSAKSRPIR